MASIDLAAARTNVAQLIDDAGNKRWTSAQLDTALSGALNRCLTDYVSAGGDRFDLETTGTTSATTGALSISSVVPFLVKQVAVTVGSTTYRLPAKAPVRRGYSDLTARALTVLYVREYALPTDTTHPLVGVAAVAANTWRGFDDWICVEAAAQLLVKDDDARLRLETHRQACERAVMARTNTPKGYPMARGEWSPVYEDLHWQYAPSTSTVYLIRVRW